MGQKHEHSGDVHHEDHWKEAVETDLDHSRKSYDQNQEDAQNEHHTATLIVLSSQKKCKRSNGLSRILSHRCQDSRTLIYIHVYVCVSNRAVALHHHTHWRDDWVTRLSFDMRGWCELWCTDSVFVVLVLLQLADAWFLLVTTDPRPLLAILAPRVACNGHLES